MASFGHLAVQIWIMPFPNPDTPYLLDLSFLCQMASFGNLSLQIWVKPFSNTDIPFQSHCGFASRWLHSETFLSRSGSSHFEPRYTFPKPLRICFQMASFGYLSIQILSKPFSNPATPSPSYGRFASRWLHFDIFQSRFGLSHSRAHIRTLKANKSVANIFVDHLITSGSQAVVSQAMGP